jgi:hypothetical protein
LSLENLEDKHLTSTRQKDKIPKTKTRGQKKTKQHSPKIVSTKFVPMETLIKDSLEAK